MSVSLIHKPALPLSSSPYRLVDDTGQDIAWANAFLDAQRIRQLSLRSVRVYAYDLLHFARWFQQHPSATIPDIDESTLIDYVRHQLSQEPQPTPQTINHRLGVLRSLYRFHCGQPVPSASCHFQRPHVTRSPLGYGRTYRVMASGIRLRQPQRVVMPLSSDEVANFWSSFHTFRDLALVALMLLDGLRSQETLDLQLEDLQLADAQIRVLGKGNRQRLLPLPPETIEVLRNYLRLERPLTNSPALFVSLKGRHRGQPLSIAGLRSLFRHHRLRSHVLRANPHRFRHTFGTDMVRDGISLPALQKLMGHAHIHTTMLYVQLAPKGCLARVCARGAEPNPSFVAGPSMTPAPDPKLHTLVTRARELQSRHRYYRIAVDSFLSWLHTDFPKVRRLSELRRDPHLLGWISCLANLQPPLADETRRVYITVLRRLLRDLAWENHSALPDLILRGDFPPRPSHRKDRAPTAPRSPFQDVFDAHIGILATTLRPGTMAGYRQIANHFLSWLRTHFPELRELSELRRDPHLLGWLRCLCEQHSPLSNRTRRRFLHLLRRLLNDFAAQGNLQPGLILLEDFPPEPKYLPRPLPLDQDQSLQQELRRTNDWLSNALLLTRATGIRIGECIDLAKDCLRSIGEDQWALHVPIGKLHTERLVPVDDSVRNIVARILELREQDPPPRHPQSVNFLLPRSTHRCAYQHLRLAIRAAAERAGCPNRITCHQLRHTYATEMLRLGVSLPALMQLLGHKTIAMTLRYVQVTQQDLQREYHLALQNATHRHFIPKLFTADSASTHSSGLDGVRQALGAARHLLEIHRRDVTDKKSQRHLQRLENRLVAVAFELERFGTA